MKSEERKSSEKQRDEAAVEQLKKLTRKLCSNDITTARLAAYNLSWMQEDGLSILTETLTGDYSRTTKKAAAYGLRSMKGRMKKMALEVLEQGLKHRDRTTRAACIKALNLIKRDIPLGKRDIPLGKSYLVKEIKHERKRPWATKKPKKSHTSFSIIIDSSVDVKKLAKFLGELAELYGELSNGDELVIRDGRIPSQKLSGSRVHT